MRIGVEEGVELEEEKRYCRGQKLKAKNQNCNMKKEGKATSDDLNIDRVEISQQPLGVKTHQNQIYFSLEGEVYHRFPANIIYVKTFHTLAKGNLELWDYRLPEETCSIRTGSERFTRDLCKTISKNNLDSSVYYSEPENKFSLEKVNEDYLSNADRSLEEKRRKAVISEFVQNHGKYIGRIIESLKLGEGNKSVNPWSDEEIARFYDLNTVILGGGFTLASITDKLVESANEYLQENRVNVEVLKSVHGRMAGLKGSIYFIPEALQKIIVEKPFISIDIGRTAIKAATILSRRSEGTISSEINKYNWENFENDFVKEDKGQEGEEEDMLALVRNYVVIQRSSKEIPFAFLPNLSEQEKIKGRENAIKLISNAIMEQLQYVEADNKEFSGIITIAISAEVDSEGKIISGGSYPGFNHPDLYLPNEISKCLEAKLMDSRESIANLARTKKEQIIESVIKLKGRYDPYGFSYFLHNDILPMASLESTSSLANKNVAILSLGGGTGFAYLHKSIESKI